MSLYLINNLRKQLYHRDHHMSEFIDIYIEDYLKSDLSESFEDVYVYNDLTQTALSIGELNDQYKNATEFDTTTTLNSLTVENHNFLNKWMMTEKGIDNTSKFMKLVKERMKALDFDERLSETLYQNAHLLNTREVA